MDTATNQNLFTSKHETASSTNGSILSSPKMSPISVCKYKIAEKPVFIKKFGNSSSNLWGHDIFSLYFKLNTKKDFLVKRFVKLIEKDTVLNKKKILVKNLIKTQNFESSKNPNFRPKKVNKESLKNFEFCVKNIESINKKECTELVALMEEYFKLLNRIYETNFFLKSILAKSQKIETLKSFVFETQKNKLDLSKKKENVYSHIAECRKTKERLLNGRKNCEYSKGFIVDKTPENKNGVNDTENVYIYEECKNQLMRYEIINLNNELCEKLKKINVKRQDINNKKAKFLLERPNTRREYSSV